MVQWIEKQLRKLHIGRRIFLVVSISIIVFTMVMLIVTNSIVRSAMENRYFENDQTSQAETGRNAELLMADISLLSVRLVGNEDLYRTFRSGEMGYEERLSIFRDTVSELIKNSAITDVVVVDSAKNIYSSGFTSGLYLHPDTASYDLIDRVTTDHLGVYGMVKDDSGESYICLGRKYYFYTVAAGVGYLYLYLPVSTLTDAVAISPTGDLSVLATGDGLVLTCTDESKIGNDLLDPSLLSGKSYSYRSLPYNNRDCTYTVRYVSELENFLNTPVYTMNIYADDALYASINRLIWLVVALELGVMGLALFLCYLATRRIVQPIHTLQDNLSDFGKDGSLVPSYVEGNDEFAELESTYNEMLGRIADLTKKNVEEKLEQRKLQLDALQAQINPHFLYNTLDTIIWIAKIKKQKEIADLAMALAGFFRISLHKGDKFIRVREELDFVKGFVLIEQTRFPDKFELIIDVDEELLDLLIFKIMIQPFVENSIKHGIAPKEGSGCITIRGRREDNDIVFQIIDDGIGIEAARAASEQGELVGLNGYGIQNVDERIRLAYGDPYGVQIESHPGVGTTVTVRVPITPR